MYKHDLLISDHVHSRKLKVHLFVFLLPQKGSSSQTSSPIPPERNEETISPVVQETVFSDPLEKPDDDDGDTEGSLPNGGTSEMKYMSKRRTHIHQAHRRVA